ncbi:MAG: MarR family transcriptional regulator, partial [Candidatus Methanomethylophilaceae archaeon]|nr:MarR family transcriptional regulator [Candidatus Methanomethylophilaceae archaeon]
SRLRPSHKETLYLYTIWSKNGCTASDLVELFDSSKALVSQTILSMEEKGYIVREKDPKDKRRQIIRLSPQRLEESKVEMGIIERSIRQISGDYSKEEIDKASEIMLRLTETMVNVTMNDAKKH